jgi:ATP-binding cassette, subfamily B, bacterial
MLGRLGLFLRHLKPHKSTLQKGSLFSVVNKLFDIAPEALIGVAVDVVVRKEQSFISQFGLTSPQSQLTFLGMATLLIWVCESLFEYLYQLQWRGLAQRVQHELRLKTYAHIQALDQKSLDQLNSGQLMSTLNDDVNQLERFLDDGMNSILQVTTSVIVIGAIFFYVSPLIAAFAILPMPFILYGAFYFQKKLAPLYALVREQAGKINARLANNLGGILTIKSFSTESYETERLKLESLKYLDFNKNAIKTSSAFIPIIRMGILCGFIVTLVLGGHLCLTGALPVGSYGVLVFLTQRLLWPLTGLAQTFNLYERSMASFERIQNLNNIPIKIKQGPKTLSVESIQGSIEFKNVSFAYDSRGGIFSGFSLLIPAGKTIGFVGATGSGKSTLIKLLLRLYETTAGTIEVDGIDIATLSQKSLRSHIGLVSQDVFLFDGTIHENICYGHFESLQVDIENAAKLAEIHEFISQLPQGYNTQVGERGVQLSGGQRQRISIARAVLKKPKILIFDEATSSVDNETENAIQRSLVKLSLGRTMIIIAHRLSSLINAETICVLEKGEIVEKGNHHQLLQMKGAYAAQWDLQTGLTQNS